MPIFGSVQITGFIAPSYSGDTYATHDAYYGRDGLRNVDTESDLDGITDLRRRAGMIVGVSGGTAHYRLLPEPWSFTFSDWTTAFLTPNNISSYGLGNRWHVPSGITVTVPNDFQTFIYGDLYVEGVIDIQENGQLVVLNGNITLSGGSIVGSGTTYVIQLPDFDTKVTNLSLSGDVLTVTQNDLSSYSVTLPTFAGGSGSCITDLYVTNIYGCSPITVHDNLQNNTSIASGYYTNAFGYGNQTLSDYSLIAGGSGNTIYLNSIFSNIVGGSDNIIHNGPAPNDSSYSSILGGSLNEIGNKARYSSILGGYNNRITGATSSAQFSTIIGGLNNTFSGTTTGSILGGQDNIVGGNYSFVYGRDINSSSSYSTIFGFDIRTDGDNLAVIGQNNIIHGSNINVLGRGNDVDLLSNSVISIVGGFNRINNTGFITDNGSGIFGSYNTNYDIPEVYIIGNFITASTTNHTYVNNLNIFNTPSGGTITDDILVRSADGIVKTIPQVVSSTKYVTTSGFTAFVTETITHPFDEDILIQFRDTTTNSKIELDVTNYQTGSVDVTSTTSLTSVRIIIVG
jgi:hypothetical protein